jgi:hypothetical protein
MCYAEGEEVKAKKAKLNMGGVLPFYAGHRKIINYYWQK